MVAPGLVIALYRPETGVLALGSAVRLEAYAVVARDLAQVALQLEEHLLVTKRLILGYERVDVCETLETAGHHLRGGVQLHRARAQWYHTVYQRYVLILQTLHVPDDSCFRVMRVEDGMRQVGSRSS